MRYLYYYYKNDGTLVVKYKDDDRRITMNYLYYSLKEALQKFRRDNGLRYKHITVQKLS